MGDAGATSGFEPDVTTYGPEAYNIVIDHCSFSWSMDGVRFCHLGAPARPPSSDELAQIGPVDVLFVPAGGPLTREDIDLIVTRLGPRVLVPMSYRTPKATRLGLSSPDAILAGRPRVTRLDSPRFRVAADTLPAEPITLVPAVP